MESSLLDDVIVKYESALSKKFGKREAKNVLNVYKRDMNLSLLNEEMVTHHLMLLLDNYPVQYITSVAHFYGLSLYVDDTVLIPRPETEELVFTILEHEADGKSLEVIDIGTGSGCIALAIKYRRKHWNVRGIDNSHEALKVARRNAEKNGLNVKYSYLDILKCCPESKYDIIVSNPPYIAWEEQDFMSESTILYEPHNALYSPNDGLQHYKSIIVCAATSLKEKGRMYLELNEFSAEKVASLFRKEGFNTDIMLDMSGKARILKATRN